MRTEEEKTNLQTKAVAVAEEVVGLLFAPASGKKTRHYIARSTKQSLDAATSAGKRWSRRTQETVDDVKANVVGVVEAGQKAYRTARDA